MSTLTIALLQLASPGPDLAQAARRGEEACRQAAARGADVALFPELWSCGYALPPDPDVAVAADGPWIGRFRALARELRMAIAVTFLELWTGGPRNALVLIDRDGEPVLRFAKVHTCSFGEEATLTPGDAFPVATLATAAGPVRVGAMICFDREFPESARLLMLAGAELVLVPNACELEVNRLAQFRARAFENMVALAMANYTAPVGNGRSVAFDGIAFDGEHRSRDMTLVDAGAEEAVLLAPLDLDALRAYRAKDMMGDAYRRPRLYGALADPAPRAPFVRADARR